MVDKLQVKQCFPTTGEQLHIWTQSYGTASRTKLQHGEGTIGHEVPPITKNYWQLIDAGEEVSYWWNNWKANHVLVEVHTSKSVWVALMEPDQQKRGRKLYEVIWEIGEMKSIWLKYTVWNFQRTNKFKKSY